MDQVFWANFQTPVSKAFYQMQLSFQPVKTWFPIIQGYCYSTKEKGMDVIYNSLILKHTIALQITTAAI